MADWLDRTREAITLIAPSGTEFTAKWSGNPMTITNKTGIHEFPGVNGAKVQDMASGPRLFDITIFFNDEDNADLDSTDFMDAFYSETGNWSIIHPTKGAITVVRVSAKEMIDPINSGGLYAVDTSWVEQIEDSAQLTDAQLQATADAQAKNLNTSSQSQFVRNGKQDFPGQKQSIISQVGKAITKIKTQLALAKNALTLDPKITAIGLAITNTLAGDIIDTSILSSQLQQLIQAYGLGQTSATDGVRMYSMFMDSILDDAPETATDNNISAIAVTELVASAAMAASGQMALIGGITSRQQTVTTVNLLLDQIANISQRLDETQTLFSAKTIDKAYFSQTDSYADALLLALQATKFLFRSLYGLPSQRIIIVREPISTMQFTKNQYGRVNNQDSDIYYYQQLVDTNALDGDDLWFLKPGKQILIYQ